MNSGSALPQIIMRFEDQDALERDLETDLGAGRAFVAGPSAVSERQRCALVLIHPASGESLELEAEAVYVKADGPGAGVGLELVDFDQDTALHLGRFAQAEKAAPEPAPEDKRADLYRRVRLFSAAEQLRSAREGDLPERVALEQIYGKAVWEVLLRNPRVTAPEVIRIARTPKLPRKLIETIVGNAAWMAVSTLRRSLLMNPQVTGASLDKVLRATPRAELTLIAKQASYPMSVRQAIKKMQVR